MSKITEYQIVNSYYMSVVKETVNKMIAEGWQPYGPLFHADVDWVQPMVRYEEKVAYTGLKPPTGMGGGGMKASKRYDRE